jgi:hypothetical protein
MIQNEKATLFDLSAHIDISSDFSTNAYNTITKLPIKRATCKSGRTDKKITELAENDYLPQRTE